MRKKKYVKPLAASINEYTLLDNGIFYDNIICWYYLYFVPMSEF